MSNKLLSLKSLKYIGVAIAICVPISVLIAIPILLLTERFTNVYDKWTHDLAQLKKVHEIGKPSGVLSFLPKQKTCPKSQNLLVQHNVPFRPTRRKKGCTYIEMRYPG